MKRNISCIFGFHDYCFRERIKEGGSLENYAVFYCPQCDSIKFKKPNFKNTVRIQYKNKKYILPQNKEGEFNWEKVEEEINSGKYRDEGLCSYYDSYNAESWFINALLTLGLILYLCLPIIMFFNYLELNKFNFSLMMLGLIISWGLISFFVLLKRIEDKIDVKQ